MSTIYYADVGHKLYHARGCVEIGCLSVKFCSVATPVGVSSRLNQPFFLHRDCCAVNRKQLDALRVDLKREPTMPRHVVVKPYGDDCVVVTTRSQLYAAPERYTFAKRTMLTMRGNNVTIQVIKPYRALLPAHVKEAAKKAVRRFKERMQEEAEDLLSCRLARSQRGVEQ